MNYWIIFLTGLTTGGLTCLVVQGGLLTATLAAREHEPNNHQNEPNFLHDVLPTRLFLGSKLVAYTLLGALLGYFGSIFQLSTTARIWFQIAAVVMMLGLAGHLLNLHPIFRYFVIQPPKWVGRILRNQSRSQHWFTPAMLGLITVLIPCGTTQAMEVLAISSGRPVTGALIMGSFVLGTSPLFLGLGWLTTRLSETFKTYFFKAAAILVIFIALSSLNAAMTLAGSKYTWDNWVWAFKASFLSQSIPLATTQEINIAVSSHGYSPNKFAVKASQPVTLNLHTSGNYACTSIFTIPALRISKSLPPAGDTQITFTPTQTGPLAFACGMGMYRGTIDVQ